MKFANLILKELKIDLKIGAEIEFYLFNATKEKIDKFTHQFKLKFNDIELEKEKGIFQFELKFPHTHHIDQLISDINKCKNSLHKLAEKNFMDASFEPKPFIDQPGSALHIHISAYQNNQNIFAKNLEQESLYLLYAIGGLCSTMKENLKIFIPTKDGLNRLIPKNNAPTTISWGGNNRTTAIRIPSSSSDDRRIEHRVSSANADPSEVIEVILSGIYKGIKHKILPPEKIYGDASDPQYNLEKLLD